MDYRGSHGRQRAIKEKALHTPVIETTGTACPSSSYCREGSAGPLTTDLLKRPPCGSFEESDGGRKSLVKRLFAKDRAATIGLFIATLLLSTASLFVGVIDIAPASLLTGNSRQLEVFIVSRLPRLLAILCVGIGMSVAGLIMQKLTMNKFVSPTTGATISSAEFGILVALLFVPGSTLVDKAVFSFFAAILGTWAFVFFIQRIKFKDIVLVPLVGIMFGSIIGGVTNYLAYKHEMLQALSSWLVGDFSLIIQGRYEIVFLVVPLAIIAFFFANHFNIVSLGKDFSKSLGVNYNFILFAGLTIAAVITASVVVTVGSIPYLGLIIPNIVAMSKGDKIRNTLVDTALFGALFVLVCDIIGRIVIFPYELPVNLIVGVIGSAVFIAMMFKQLGGRRKREPLEPMPGNATTITEGEEGR